MSDTQEGSAYRLLTEEQASDLEMVVNRLQALAMRPGVPPDLYSMFQRLDEIRRHLTGED